MFDILLPALARLDLPVPLGGTSNHFPRAALEALGGWDAHNVTEDADLGVRIARRWGRVAVLASTTEEEAPATLRSWLPQRTRWLKGFMQTWLVHNRRPLRLLRELGLVRFVAFQAFVGGVVASALLHPVFLGVLAFEVANGELFNSAEATVDQALVAVAAFNLVAGYLVGIATAALAAGRRGLWRLFPSLVLMPAYWLLISAAAWRALVQLLRAPHLWEKTHHTTRRRRSASRRRGNTRRA